MDADDFEREEPEADEIVYNMKNLLSYLPPKTKENEHHHTVLANFLASDSTARLNPSVAFKDYHLLSELFHKLKHAAMDVGMDEELVDALTYYENYFENEEAIAKIEPKTNFESLLNVIPEPKDSKLEKKYYGMIKSFVGSGDAKKVLLQVLSAKQEDVSVLLKNISEAVLSSGLSKELAAAFKYYATILHKEIVIYAEESTKKSLNLTKIFAETLDFKNMIDENKESFVRLFNYLSEEMDDKLAKSIEWDEGLTQGGFTVKFLNFLLGQKFVPDGIKEDIKRLVPLVKMDEKGGLLV